MFEFYTVREALKLMDESGFEILRGHECNGLYVTDKNEYTSKKGSSIFVAQFKPVSLYDRIHQVTGHSGKKAIKWH